MEGRMTRRRFTAFVAAQPLVSQPVLSASTVLPMPTGAVILTVRGRIRIRNQGDTAQFDRQMLEALGTSSFTTRTPWHDRAVTFEGVSLMLLMHTVGAQGDSVTVLALNDYVTEIPIIDFAEHGVLLALKTDGSYMPVHDKGPLFIIYPFDRNPELENRRYYGRSAWQVAELTVK
jgi:hypothetical protein